MDIVCLDLEGVLVPEIWIAFSEATGIPELKRTTRDEPDYDKLMNYRLNILKEHHLGLKDKTRDTETYRGASGEMPQRYGHRRKIPKQNSNGFRCKIKN